MDKKEKQDATEYSKDAFLDNRVACANDCTGYMQRPYMNAREAESLADLVDATAKDKDAEIR